MLVITVKGERKVEKKCSLHCREVKVGVDRLALRQGAANYDSLWNEVYRLKKNMCHKLLPRHMFLLIINNVKLSLFFL